MKRLTHGHVLLLAALSLLAVSPAAPAAAAGSAAPVVTGSTDFATAYIFRGLRQTQGAWQPGLTLTQGGWNCGVWANVPFDRNEGDEIIPWLFYSLPAGGVTWEAGVQGFLYPGARDRGTVHSCELALAARAPLGLLTGVPVTAGLNGFYDFRYATLSLEANLEHSVEFKLGARPAEVAAGVFLGHIDARNLTPGASGPRWRDAYTYGGAKLSVSLKLSARAALKLTGQWDAAHNAAPGQGHTGNLSGLVGCTWVW
jgi:uncharacterized protein (TIGR02001 family)